MKTRFALARCCCGCRYKIEARLEWTDPENRADLDIYVRDVDRSEVAWYANKTTTYLTLNGDRYPNCADSGPDAEIITGSFKQSNEFETWYNQYSDCAPELAPSTKQFKVTNTGSQAITVNGTTVQPGNSWTTELEYAGYATGSSPGFTPADSIIVQCSGES